jgi:hypothetical protein
MERKEKYRTHLTLHISIEILHFPSCLFSYSCLHKNVDSDNHVITFAIDRRFGLADKLSCCLERNTVVDREGEASSAIISANDWS